MKKTRYTVIIGFRTTPEEAMVIKKLGGSGYLRNLHRKEMLKNKPVIDYSQPL
jgi:hypothetical protein